MSDTRCLKGTSRGWFPFQVALRRLRQTPKPHFDGVSQCMKNITRDEWCVVHKVSVTCWSLGVLATAFIFIRQLKQTSISRPSGRRWKSSEKPSTLSKKSSSNGFCTSASPSFQAFQYEYCSSWRILWVKRWDVRKIFKKSDF